MILELLSFFTRLPVGRASIEKASRNSYLLPLLGILIGGIVGLFSFLSFKFIDQFLATLLTLVCLYFVTGLNHLDGLADFADGLHTCGSRKRKVRAMKDTQIGIAGVTFTLFTILFLASMISIINGDFYKIIVVEICAKTAMLFALLIGKPMKKGIGKEFIRDLNRISALFSILFSFLISFVLLRYIGILAILVSILTSLILVKIAHNNFGAINGDVIGAINELSRISSLLAIVVMF